MDGLNIIMDLKLRRRAIYTGMRPYFDDAALLEAIHLWQIKYSDKPKFAFTEFLSECCQDKALRAQRTTILSSIFKALDTPERDLLPDPFDIDQDQLIQLAPAEKICDDTTIVFVHFLDNLLKSLVDKDALTVRIYILNQFPSLRLDELRKAFLRDWLDKKSNKLPVSYELSVMRQVVNFAYVAICEIKGPVKADQLLSQAIKSSDELAKQMEIPLHDFL
jgi:hypothetical protein